MRKLRKISCTAVSLMILFTLVSMSPVHAAPSEKAVILRNTIASGTFHTLAIKSDGSLWAWGLNAHGELGDGTNTNRVSPVKIMDDVASVSAGQYYSMAIKTDGSLWVWGCNINGQLGDGTTDYRNKPYKIMDNVICVSAGGECALAVKDDYSLWAWGANDYGQLGDGTTTDKMTPIKIMDDVKLTSAGSWHAAAIKSDGSLWEWGYGRTTAPEKVLDDVKSISLGGYHTMAIKTDGSLWAWGGNYSGQLGDGTTEDKYSPIRIMDGVKSVSAGNGYTLHGYTLAVKTDDSLWAWGINFWGQLGDGTTARKTLPVKIMDEVASASAYGGHSVALKTDGNLWTWGMNEDGQLGDGTTIDQLAPVKVMNDVALSEYDNSTQPPAVSAELPTEWARADVSRSISQGLVPYVLQSEYPQAITRAEFCFLAVVLYENITGEDIEGYITFSDTNDTNVRKAAYIGVVNGTSPGKFTPNASLTREQAATMLARLATAIGKPFPVKATTFGDKGTISDWALEAVGQVQAAGIMNGTSPTNFSPKGPYTREQSIVTMLRMYDAME